MSAELTETQRHMVAHYANRLPFVQWDRFTSHTDKQGDVEDTCVILYGWIVRGDGRFDFVVLAWFHLDRQPCPWSVTSSANHSAEISRLLYHDQPWWAPEEHVDCQRVQHTFDGMINQIVRL